MTTEILQLGGPHLKKCKCGCGTEFFGRKNQKFLNIRHKSLSNNNIRSERNEYLAPIFAQMSNNIRILIKYFPQSKGQEIPYSPLLKEGFNPNAPCEIKKAVDTGVEYRFLSNYYFRQTRDNKHIIISKIDHGNTNK